MSSYQYRDSHVKDKTVSPTVLSLTWESPYLGNTVFILRRGPGPWTENDRTLPSNLHGEPGFNIWVHSAVSALTEVHHESRATNTYQSNYSTADP